MKRDGFVGGWLVWFIALLIGIIIANYLTRYLGNINFPSDKIFLMLYYGLILELCSKIMQFFVFDRKASVNIHYAIHFLFWVIIQSIVFWIGGLIVMQINWWDFLIIFGRFGLYEGAIRILLLALIQVILLRIIWILRLEKRLIPYGSRKKNYLMLIIILVLLVCVYAFNNSSIKIQNPVKSNSVSIKDLSQNPSNYAGKEVTIRGALKVVSMYGSGNSLVDNEGNYIVLDGNCFAWGKRTYDLSGGTSYTATGKIGAHNVISCTSPLK